MELDSDKLLEEAIKNGLREGVEAKMKSSYDNPLDKMIKSAIDNHGERFRDLLSRSLTSCLGDKDFREEIAVSIRHTLAKTLISRFGGELEKQVNVLKSDPTTRARITVAIEEIVKSKFES